MVINHLDKLFVTNDAATIVNELEVQHPAAKILILAGRAQQEEIGDGANLTISFAGELLEKAEELIRMGLHPSEIIIGYTKAINKTAVRRRVVRASLLQRYVLSVCRRRLLVTMF
jgi:T-complex protein 1 subunit theta